MPQLTVKQALATTPPVSDIQIQGWVRTRRDAKEFSFLEINDGSSLKGLQVIVDQGTPGADQLPEMNTGAAVSVWGELIASLGKGQAVEIKASKVALVGPADAETYPLQKKRHSDEFLRTIAHLRPRTNKFGAMFRIRSEADFAVRQFFRDRGFQLLHAPILTGSDCEGAGELFQVTTLNPAKGPYSQEALAEDFFGRESYLTVSGQLSAETFAQALGKVYTFGPTFRAENSNTVKHAAEFWMIEPEMAFADIHDNMDLAEDILKYLIGHLRRECADDLSLFAQFVDKELMATLDNIEGQPFVRLPYAEAIEILATSKKKFDYPVAMGQDLQTEHERYLTEEHFKRPVAVYDWPKEIKAFYMRQNDDGKTVAAMDVLVPRVGEIVGGSQREERFDRLEQRLQELKMPMEGYWWYLDLRRFGTTPHAGFGMGFERFLMLVTGVTNIRDVIPYPRTPKHLEF